MKHTDYRQDVRDEEKSGPVLTWTHNMSAERRKRNVLGEESLLFTSRSLYINRPHLKEKKEEKNFTFIQNFKSRWVNT